MPELPDDLKEAFERGQLTTEQLQQLIALEASVVGLTFEQAVEGARTRSLPPDWVSDDLELLISMLPN